jgi:hypothetical protein
VYLDTCAFQEELASQDGLRLYECLLWYLQRTTKLDSDIVTWCELWQAFEQQPEVLHAVMPGLFRMQWVLQPSEAEHLDEEVGTNDPPGTSHHEHHHHDCDQRPKGTQHHSHHRRTIRDGTHEDSMDTAHLSRKSSKGFAWAERRASKQQLVEKSLSRQVSKDKAKTLNSQSAVFRRVVTNRFQASLRKFGEVRHAELQEGFRDVTDLNVTKRDSLLLEDVDASTPTAAVSMSPQHLGATAFNAIVEEPGHLSTTGMQTPEPARPRSSPASGKASRSMPRSNSAPSPVASPFGDRPKSQGFNGNVRLQSASELPTIDSFNTQKWGLEAADRFRLFSQVRSSRNNQRHLKGSCGHTDAVGYKCQLCRSQHTMLTSF